MKAVLLASLTLLGACAAGANRFPAESPLWEDRDRIPFAGKPEEYFSPLAWDGADQTVFRPVSRFFAVDPGGEATNVNSLDEVPNSSWFQNRIGWFSISPERLVIGPCDPPKTDPKPPWTVTGAKPNGANPGFIVKDSKGDRYLVKFDGDVQGPRATGADVIVSKIYWAAGYSVPCNQIVFFDRSTLSIDPEAEAETSTGQKEPLTEKHLDQVFDKALRLADGRYRASTSKFLEGKPLGPFTYQGTRDDDLNDVVPHEDRRDLRGSYVLAAWTQHFDAREQNTLSMWMETQDNRGYVDHNIIDFGDCFGSIWEPPPLGRRIGNAYYLDIPYVLEDLITFGAVRRPWDWARFGASGPVFGYYDVERFEPDMWRAGYPNPAFSRVTERDAAWMTRIVSRLTNAHLDALVRIGRFRSRFLEQELYRILVGRRNKILRRYFSKLSPLSHPAVVRGENGSELCLRDLAVSSNVVDRGSRSYAARSWKDGALDVTAPGSADFAVCAKLPPPSAGGYLVVDVDVSAPNEPPGPARVHLSALDARRYRIVGLERPEDGAEFD